MDGIIVVNKPNGLTSHDVVDQVRRKFKMRRVGHAGTLDPLATGVLVMLLGRATKRFAEFSMLDKAYRAVLILGTSTDSADIQGRIIQKRPYRHITRDRIEDIFRTFEGEIDQVPPMVSAVKVKGKKLYHLARKGIEVKRPSRRIRIHCLKLLGFHPPEVEFYLECSKGTYVRQLAEDIGKILECGACITRIERTKVGSFSIEDAVKIEDLNESHIRHWQG